MGKPTFSFLKRRIVIPLVVLWLLAMILITTAVAKDFCSQLESGAMDFLQTAIGIKPEENVPGSVENAMLRSLTYPYLWLNAEPLFPFQLPQRPGSIGTDDWFWGKWELVYGFQAAAAYYDSQDNCLFYSGDWYSFCYYDKNDTLRYGYIDLNTLEDGSKLADRYFSAIPWGDIAPFTMANQVKLSGWFEGNEFHPIRIHADSPLQMVYERDVQPQSTFTSILTDTDLDPYHWSWGLNYVPGSAFTVDGQHFDSVVDVLTTPGYYTQDSIFNTLIHRSQSFRLDGREYTVSIAVQCYPLLYAMLRLLPAYLVSGLVLAILISFILRRIRKDLTEPLQVINRCYENDRPELSPYADSPLQELQTLGAHFNEKQRSLHGSRNELQQLRTALTYAQTAEENRRKMVSAIAHELKTPLAVIHSYAEGLQAGIAKDKAAQYLSVILEETEQMDAMVLEMLDLSRLEAGKVRLSSDSFSLLSLTRSVFQKLELAAQAKALQIRFVIAEDFSILADEGRIGQVITNFATNAIKYTPAEGSIRIKIYRFNGFAWFSIENDSPPLPQEVLSQIWDSFYRADTARSGSGTGLGLAIAKSIIQLHRGSCFAQNTKAGVEFRFSLPI